MANTKYSLVLDEDTHDQILSIMEKTNKTKAEVSRDLIKRGLALQWQDENADMLAMLIRNQVDLAMKNHVERLAALSSKAGHMSARSAFLNAQVLVELVDKEKRREVKELWESASKKAVEYMKKPVKKWDYLSELMEENEEGFIKE